MLDCRTFGRCHGQACLALGEVAFSVSAVPEPEQALMLPAGLLMLAAWRAPRNRRAA